MINNKAVILRKNQTILSLLYCGSKLLSVNGFNEEESLLGNVYIGKIKNITPNIAAAFVEIEDGKICFLSIKDVKNPVLTNRSYDGRLITGDELVVQVKKDAVKTKPPTVSTEISLSGKYCAVSFKRPGIAYSSKLSQKVKKRIEENIENDIRELGKEYGIVIRTNARELMDFMPLKEEAEKLAANMAEMIRYSSHRTCYCVLYKCEPDYLRFLRDLKEGQCEEAVTDDIVIYNKIREYQAKNPEYFLPEIKLYQDKMLPLEKLYSVETKLSEALGKRVWLKSGGYLVIEPTEALTVIDVNTGKYTGKKEKEETYYLMNKEAAKEIAHQLTLRNISGIILVDFINMKSRENENTLMAYLGDLLKKDPITTNLHDITVLGLVEITRKTTGKPLKELL